MSVGSGWEVLMFLSGATRHGSGADWEHVVWCRNDPSLNTSVKVWPSADATCVLTNGARLVLWGWGCGISFQVAPLSALLNRRYIGSPFTLPSAPRVLRNTDARMKFGSKGERASEWIHRKFACGGGGGGGGGPASPASPASPPSPPPPPPASVPPSLGGGGTIGLPRNANV